MIRLLPITTQASPYWDSLVRIYLQSFPIDEQRPIESIARLITKESHYTLYAIVNTTDYLPSVADYTSKSSNFFREEGYQQPIGLLSTWEFEDFIYIEHFAIEPSLRSQGYGTKAIQTFIQEHGKPIILEVEPPTNEQSIHRIHFYEWCGLILYEYPYIQPAYTPTSNPIPLRLMGTIDLEATPLTLVSNILHKEVYALADE